MDATLRRERLENLMRVVKAAPHERFDMERWLCGTTRCAVGWCALDPYFQSLGLSVRRSPGYLAYEPYVGDEPCGIHGIGFGADLAPLFGLTLTEAGQVFLPDNYLLCRPVEKSDVLDRIVALIDATPKPVALPAPEALGAAR